MTTAQTMSLQNTTRLSKSLPLIRNIWAVGRNYADHAKELGNQVPATASDPMIFLKAGSSLVENGAAFPLPRFTSDVHHEAEIALRFGPEGQFSEITVALDLTAREVQNRLKAQAHPWTLAKSFQASCPVGPLTKVPEGTNLQDLQVVLKVNGEIRQNGFSRDMIHPIEKLRQFVLDHFPVCEGDLLLTGTPAGVGPLRSGDRLEAEILVKSTGGETQSLVKAQWRVSEG